jgi:ubiquitin C-terminal hydrolase
MMGSDEEEDSEEKNEKSVKDYEFKLVGVVCHMGIAEAGHYLSYINVERDSETQEIPRDEWVNIEK